MCRTRFAARLAAFCAAAFFALPGMAMDVPEDEYPRLKQCEERVCTMILKKEPVGDDLKCKLSKTWASQDIKGGETKNVTWGFGDARCTVNLELSRADIIGALTQPEYTISLPSHTVKCEVEREGELKPVNAKLAPKMTFKNGKADKVWVNLTDLNGPGDIKGTVWAAANLEDSLGIFHGAMIKQMNKFIHKKCDDLYGPSAVAKAIKKLRKEQKRAAAIIAKAKREEAAAKKAAGDKPAPAASAPAAPPPPAPAAAPPAPAPAATPKQ